jgi:hypothetical protein
MILPPVIGANYDYCYSILNATRARLNDRMSSLFPTGGKILDETTASTQQFFNNAFRKLQDMLCDSGVERFQSEIVITDIPAVTNSDPAAQISMSWTGYFDGTNASTTPALPSDLILPLWIAERPSGQAAVFPPANRPNMTCYMDGLPMQQKQNRNIAWEWRGDAIYAPGALVTVDWRIRYRAWLSDIVDVGTTRWWNQPFPIMRCQDAMTLLLCAEFAQARAAAAEPMMGGTLTSMAGSFMAQAKEAVKMLSNRDAMKNERNNVRRIPYGGGTRGSSGFYR